jgi:hypothetical protein
MSNNVTLPGIGQVVATEDIDGVQFQKMLDGNALHKFRDGFAIGTIDSAVWDSAWINQGNGFVSFGGNSSGTSYLRVNLDPTIADTEFRLTSKGFYKFPIRFGFGISSSQRIVGQEYAIEIIGCDSNGTISENAVVSVIPISGTITIATNVATINTATAHGLRGGDRVVISGNADNRLDVGPVVVTVVTATQFTVPCTLANGTYTAGGNIVWADPLAYAYNGASLLFENATTTNASFVERRNGTSFRSLNSTITTTTATQTNTAPYTDSFNSGGDFELLAGIEDIEFITRTSDSIATAGGAGRFSQGIPDDGNYYKIRLRFKQLPNFSHIQANIATAAKTGTTTATFVTDVPHGLVTGQYVSVYGMRDQANFPNTASTLATVVDSTTFTIVCGTATTTNTTGGVVCPWDGSVNLPGAINLSIQSIQRTSNIITVTMNTTAAGLLPGEYCYLGGMDGSAAAYNGSYKVLRLNATTYELESTGVDFGLITCGGAVVKLTDLRLHYVRMMDYTRHVVELSNGRGAIDLSRAIPVQGNIGTVSAVTAVTTLTTLTTLTSMSQVAGIPANSFIYDQMHSAWANSVRRAVS